MALFRKKGSAQSAAPAWTPHVDLATAGPLIHALTNAPDNVRLRLAIAGQLRASEAPTDMRDMVGNFRADPDIITRPWIWLVAVQREAVAAGDHHLSAAALLWACFFTSMIVPKYDRPIGVWADLKLDLIPRDVKAEIMALGLSSAALLPRTFVIANDGSGDVTPEWLAAVAPNALGN